MMAWFELKGDERLGRCATDDCGQAPIYRMEAGGVGANYCSACREKIEFLSVTAENIGGMEYGPETEAVIERDGHFINVVWWKYGRRLHAEVYEPMGMDLSPALADILALSLEQRPKSDQPPTPKPTVEAEPVAWQAKFDDGIWRYVEMPKTAAATGYELRPLYPASALQALQVERDKWRQAWEADGRDVRYFSKAMTAQARAETAESRLSALEGKVVELADQFETEARDWELRDSTLWGSYQDAANTLRNTLKEVE